MKLSMKHCCNIELNKQHIDHIGVSYLFVLLSNTCLKGNEAHYNPNNASIINKITKLLGEQKRVLGLACLATSVLQAIK